jgi:hypothetical protein
MQKFVGIYLCLCFAISPLFDILIASFGGDKAWILRDSRKRLSCAYLVWPLFFNFVLRFTGFSLVSLAIIVGIYLSSLFLSKISGMYLFLLNLINKCSSGDTVDSNAINDELKERTNDYKETPFWLIIFTIWIFLCPFIVGPLFAGSNMSMFFLAVLTLLSAAAGFWVLRYTDAKCQSLLMVIFDSVQRGAINEVQSLRKIIERRLGIAKIFLLVILVMCAMGFRIMLELS